MKEKVNLEHHRKTTKINITSSEQIIAKLVLLFYFYRKRKTWCDRSSGYKTLLMASVFCLLTIELM
jgi:hypothetical protein